MLPEIIKMNSRPEKNGQPIRLNRYIANSGVCSRREADNLILKGMITVNGKTVTDLGVRVKLSDDVRYKNAAKGFIR